MQKESYREEGTPAAASPINQNAKRAGVQLARERSLSTNRPVLTVNPTKGRVYYA